MGSGVRLAAALLVGVLLGAAGYGVVRGDLSWRVPGRQGASAASPGSSERAEVRSAGAQGEADALPELPLTLSYHDDPSGRGYTVQIHNPSQKHFVVKVELNNPTLDQRQEKVAQLAPGEMAQIGSAQGWTFFTGETIRLLHEGYQAKELTIP